MKYPFPVLQDQCFPHSLSSRGLGFLHKLAFLWQQPFSLSPTLLATEPGRGSQSQLTWGGRGERSGVTLNWSRALIITVHIRTRLRVIISLMWMMWTRRLFARRVKKRGIYNFCDSVIMTIRGRSPICKHGVGLAPPPITQRDVYWCKLWRMCLHKTYNNFSKHRLDCGGRRSGPGVST